MISGENMKKKVTVKRKHRYTQESDILYRGTGEYERKDGCIKLRYTEKNIPLDIQVEVDAFQDHIELKRSGETKSNLYFKEKETTKGVLSSTYGDMDIDLYTYRYIRKDNVITLEYDILSAGEVSGGYHIIWNIKEE